MKKIAAITMARNDNFFVEKWINYYGFHLGEKNIYVFLDGEDQEMPSNGGKANVIVRKHAAQSRASGDKSRIAFLSEFAKKLFVEHNYDLVIGTDCDEFLVVDPDCNMPLAQYLTSINIPTSVSALGIDIGQNLKCEKELDLNKPILLQRNFAVVSPRYTKSIVIAKPVMWGSGFHRVKNHNFHIDKNLYLFHLGYCDIKMLEKKSNGDRINNGWSNHLKRRSQTITLISKSKNIKGSKETMLKARFLQTLLRPVFAWNKPSMGFWNLIIRIPEKFNSIPI